MLRPGIERIGDQHGVLDRRDIDAVTRENEQIIFHIMRDLEDSWRPRAAASVSRAPRASGNLTGQSSAPPKRSPLAVRAMPERNVAGAARRSIAKRDADKLAAHRIERGRFGVERDDAGLERVGDPSIEALERTAPLHKRTIDCRRPRLASRARGGQARGRRALARVGGLRPAPISVRWARAVARLGALRRCARASRRRPTKSGSGSTSLASIP